VSEPGVRKRTSRRKAQLGLALGKIVSRPLGLVQTRVTLAPVRFVAGRHWGPRRSARIGPPPTTPKCYPKTAHFEPGRPLGHPPARPPASLRWPEAIWAPREHPGRSE